MRALELRTFIAVLVVLGGAACAYQAAVPPVAPEAQAVRIEASDPPSGATLVGPIAATHGSGCGIGGDGRGSLAGATALLRQAALQHGVSYVKLTAEKKPYAGHDCFHQEYTLSGLGYRLAGVAAPAAPVVPAPAPSTAPAMNASAPTVASAPTSALTCTPLCSPGYECRAGVCEPLCNPACLPEQKCRTDRVCVPANP